MKSYRVYKNVNKQPYILGLRLSLFYLYILLLIIVIFLLSTGITFIKLAFCTGLKNSITWKISLLLIPMTFSSAIIFSVLDMQYTNFKLYRYFYEKDNFFISVAFAILY